MLLAGDNIDGLLRRSSRVGLLSATAAFVLFAQGASATVVLPLARGDLLVSADAPLDSESDVLGVPQNPLPLSDSTQALGDFGGSASAQSTIVGGDDPSLRVGAEAVGGIGGGMVVNSDAEGFASLSYDFEIVGSGTPISIAVKFQGSNSPSESVDSGDGQGVSNASVELGIVGDAIPVIIEGGGAYDTTLMLSTYTLYEVDMSATAQIINAGLVSLVENAFVDPKLSLDASLTGESIEYSANLGNAVPEPATWAMLLLGFSGLGLAGYRASRRTAVVSA